MITITMQPNLPCKIAEDFSFLNIYAEHICVDYVCQPQQLITASTTFNNCTQHWKNVSYNVG
jgi:hypothetical protein